MPSVRLHLYRTIKTLSICVFIMGVLICITMSTWRYFNPISDDIVTIFNQRIASPITSQVSIQYNSGNAVSWDGKNGTVVGMLSNKSRTYMRTTFPFTTCFEDKGCKAQWMPVSSIGISIPAITHIPGYARILIRRATTDDSRCIIRRWIHNREIFPTAWRPTITDQSLSQTSHEVFCFSVKTGAFVYDFNEW